MSGYADGTDGWTSTDTSQERAEHQRYSGKAEARKVAILRHLADARDYGITVVDARDHMHLGHHGEVSSDLTNLHKDNTIVRTKRKRDRSHIYVLPHHALATDTLEPYIPRAVKTDARVLALEDRVARARMALLEQGSARALRILEEQA